ncbi:MAG: uroporphyrinogen-III C-methyltransferase [Sulfurifustis sp.]
MDSDDDLTADVVPTSRDRRWRNGSGRSGRVSGGLALILSVLALLVTGYLWYALIYTRPELMRMDVPRALSNVENSNRELKVALDDAKSQLDLLRETQNTLKTAVDKMQSDLGRNQAQWMLGETEQLLSIANRRLQLARDVTSALAALRAADRQLELLARPGLLPIRKEIAREIGVLESLQRTDVDGISLRLATLADGIDQLPLAPDLRMTAEQKAATQVAEAGRDSGASLWKDLLSLVRVRRYDTMRPPLPPEQQYYARENLRLMLYGAQHAVLQGNAPTYQQNLKTATRWIADYFDRDAPTVTTTQAELERLRAIPVMGELPDITPSLEMLHKALGRAPNS